MINLKLDRIEPEKEKTVLVKEPINIPDRELGSLAKEAKEVLGYNLLSTSIGAERLSEALAELDIEVFPNELVDKYQAEKMQDEYKNPENRGREVLWKETLIENYGQPIPEHVINKAIQIKKKVPEVNLFIEHLVSRNPDPFLVASLGEYKTVTSSWGTWKTFVLSSRKYYIEVWDEPKFEGRITKEETIK